MSKFSLFHKSFRSTHLFGIAVALLAFGMFWAGANQLFQKTPKSTVIDVGKLPPQMAFAPATDLHARVLEIFPGIESVDSIEATPVPSLYEIVLNGKDIFYIDSVGNHLFKGELLDVDRRVNLTQERMDELLAIDFGKLPLADALVHIEGDGKRTLAVFSDPNCPYCKHFEGELDKLKNVTIYTFLMPILGPDSMDKAKALWCSDDPAQAYKAWMTAGTEPVAGDNLCDTSALERNVAFAQAHRITGTPTSFFSDGTRLPGAVPIAQIEAQLDAEAGADLEGEHE